MQPMQDKDFDQLLKQRFDAFEAEPSTGLWNSISAELDKKNHKKRKIRTPFWMAAASVLILASAVFWLNKPVEVIKLHPKSQGQVALKIAKEPAAETAAEENSVPEAVSALAEVKTGRSSQPKTFIARKKQNVTSGETEKRSPQRVHIAEDQVNRATLALQEDKAPVNSPKTDISRAGNPAVIAQNDEDVPEEETYTEPARPRIKSIGGLVNFVVAQVDKRENKIIEFKDGEEGSEVSGINLGPLKFKSRNK